ncbi:MAG: radical SAM protein [Bacteroidales bacterium]|jgi:radical SAM protein with 4Fe4S-binding SPASM domain|nr:radical SAM protein [Bacteroidales bacterium]
MNKYIPINKGNYSMETHEREMLFDKYRSEGWELEYRQYRDNWDKFPKSFYVNEYPLLVDLELSTLCNIKCPMCYTITDEFKNKIKTGFMDIDLFKIIIDEIGNKVPAIRLSLRGESTLHPDFIETIRYARSKGIKEISTLTNGSNLTESFIKKMVDAGIDWITISIDGIGKIYEKIRRPLKFKETLDKIKMLDRIKKERNLHKPVIKIQSIWPAIKENPESYYNLFSPIVDLIAFNPLIDYLSKDKDILYEKNFSCPQLYQRLVVGSDGNVMACSNDECGSNIIGNANNEKIKEIWHGEKLTKIRGIHKIDNGFLAIDVCKKCYIPRLTEDNETACVNGRKFIIKNYVNRTQKIGE